MQNLIILLVTVYLIDAISLWRLFELAGEEKYKAFIPFYNRYTQLEILERPKWWIIILIVPVVGVIFHLALHADFIRCYGYRKFLDGLLVFLSFGLYVTYVNYNKNTKWEGVEERKETFVASIIFAIIFATAIHIFVAQPFIIPTSSMENTLRRGDFLIVNKIAYGSRIPLTPIGLPFLQNKIPKTGERPGDQVDSYVDAFRLPYMRIPGYEKIKNNSLVVFNYPTDSLHEATDRKDPYVKRCIGLPGDSIKIDAGNLYINGKAEVLPADAERQYSYWVKTDGSALSPQAMEKQIGFISDMVEIQSAEYLVEGVSNLNLDSINTFQFNNVQLIDSIRPYNDKYKMYTKRDLNTLNSLKGIIPGLANATIELNKVNKQYYFDGLTDKMVSELKAMPYVTGVTKNLTAKGVHNVHYYGKDKIDSTNTIFPEDKIWNIDNYGPLYIPKKGDKIQLNTDNLAQYFNIVNHYEDNNVEIKNNKIWVDGKEVPTYDYTIQKDYYFMMGDNRHQSLDSRFFGYVPFDHVVGKPSFWWMSMQGMFENGSFKIRFNRMFKVPNNGVPIDEKFNWGWIIIPLIVLFFIWDDRRRKKKKAKQ